MRNKVTALQDELSLKKSQVKKLEVQLEDLSGAMKEKERQNEHLKKEYADMEEEVRRDRDVRNQLLRENDEVFSK